MTTDPPRPQSSPVLKVLAIVGLVFLLIVLLLFGTCAYCVMSNPEVRKMGAIVGETVKMGMAASKAPGTGELREAGCDEAMVMDLRALVSTIKEMETEGSVDARIDLPEHEWQKTMVICQLTSGEPSLGCADVARVYGSAVDHPPSEFGVLLRVGFPRRDVCQGVYAPDGVKTREIDIDGVPHAVPHATQPSSGDLPLDDVESEAIDGAVPRAPPLPEEPPPAAEEQTPPSSDQQPQ